MVFVVLFYFYFNYYFWQGLLLYISKSRSYKSIYVDSLFSIFCPKATQHHPLPSRNKNKQFLENPSSHTLSIRAIVYLYSAPALTLTFSSFSHKQLILFLLLVFPCIRIYLRSSRLEQNFFIPFCSYVIAPWPRCPTIHLTSPLFLNFPTTITDNAAVNNLKTSYSSCENIPTGQSAGQSMCAVITLMMSPNCLPLEVYQCTRRFTNSPSNIGQCPSPQTRHHTALSNFLISAI